MTTQAKQQHKNTSFKLSNQVKTILHKNGLSKVFNYADYKHFKSQSKKAFNKAQSIADLFIEEHRTESDLNEYTF